MRKSGPILSSLLGASLMVIQLPHSIPAGDEGGVIVGTVHFAGTPPPPERIEIDKDPDVCGTGFREVANVSVGADGALRNVVICVEGNEAGPVFAKPEGGFKLDQKGCRFLPEVQVVSRGDKLRITNRDPIIHNIHTYERIRRVRKDLFRFPQPERGHRRTETIDPTRSNTVELTCDIHSFMHGWMYVSEGDSCVVSDDGHFKINRVPEGIHTVKVWHPTLGEQETEVSMTSSAQLTVEFEFSAD